MVTVGWGGGGWMRGDGTIRMARLRRELVHRSAQATPPLCVVTLWPVAWGCHDASSRLVLYEAAFFQLRKH